MFFVLLFGLILFLFKNAFSINFFSDDYFFLKISRALTVTDFANFFSPIREHSYKPVGTEVYYYLIHLFGDNIFIGHLITFIVFFVGLYYLHRVILKTSRIRWLANIAIFLYGINFVHVFQLYYFGTFQEVAMLTFLAMALSFFLDLKLLRAGLFFVLALLSKETAVLFAVFLPMFIYIFHKDKLAKYKKGLLALIAVAGVFTLLYQYSLGHVTQLENYKIHLNPRLFANNVMWYLLWSLGLPNYMPDYMTSIFSPPIKEFWKVFVNYPETKIYFGLLFGYLGAYILSLTAFVLKQKRYFKNIAYMAAFSLLSFVLFIGPIGFFLHKWMIRLTLPLVFISLFQGYTLYLFYKTGGFYRKVFYLLIVLYFTLNVFGVRIHESSSTFFLESRISDHLKSVVDKNRPTIGSKKHIYFEDVKIRDFNPWGQSKHLKTTLSDQNFVDLYFPGEDIKAVYGFEDKKVPNDSFVIRSLDLLRP
jgi:hypothetical protein